MKPATAIATPIGPADAASVPKTEAATALLSDAAIETPVNARLTAVVTVVITVLATRFLYS
ncbi:hypothetical protein D3C80_1624460 [compost metagenome]